MSYTPGFGDAISLAGEIKEAYDSVQGNPKLCKLLNDQVQHVASSFSKSWSKVNLSKIIEMNFAEWKLHLESLYTQ